MKTLIKVLLFTLIGLSAKAQQLPSSTFPSRIFNGNTKAQWILLDSPVVNPILDTFHARYAGTQIVRIQGGDTAFWFYGGNRRWFRSLLDRDTLSLSNRINLKLNIGDTAAMLLPYLRKADTTNKWVQDVYVRNDSLFKFKNGAETFLDTLGNGGGGGSGTVTSVGLSLPSAFNVTPSSITTSGTFAVTGAGTTSQYIRGNGTLATTDTGMIPNFHLKVRSLFSATSPLTYNSTSGIFAINNANVSGTKGAATFNSVSFSDNGSGLISLNQPVAPGSCINCDITWGSDGRPTSYASGTPPQFVNAPGAGDTLSILDTLKRLNAGFGITHVVTNYNITQKVDTSDIATQFDISGFPSGSGVANQITYWTGTNTIGGDAGFTVNATTNTIITDTIRPKQVVISGDSTVTSKIVFAPIKPKTGSMPWRIGFDEQNNQHDADSTVDPVFEIKYGALDGTGRYLRTAWEGNWRPFPGASYFQSEVHVVEVGYGPTLGNLIVRPLAWTGSWAGDDGTWSHRANLHSFFDWNGQKSLGGFSRGAGEFITYHNYSGNAITEMSIRDTGTSVRAAGIRIDGQVSAGTRLNRMDYYGQQIDQFYESAPVFRTGKGGANNSVFNYIFNIADTNTAAVLFAFTKGAGPLDNVYFWGHNDGRIVSGDAGFFFPGYKFQAKSQGSNNAFIAGTFDASNNTVIYPGNTGHALTSGAGAAGIGSGIKFRADNSANTLREAGSIEGVFTTTTNNSEVGDVVIRTMREGILTEANRSYGSGEFSISVTDSTSSPANMAWIDPITRKVKVAAAPASATTLYTGDGTLASNRTVSTNGFTTTWTGSNDSETSFTVANTGTTNASAILGSAIGTTSVGVTGTSTSYIGVYGSSTSNNGVQGESSSSVGVVGVSSTGSAFRGQINPTSTNAIENIVTLLRTTSSGAGANGIGSSIQYELETATSGTSQVAGSLSFEWTDAINTSRTSRFSIKGVNNATNNTLATFDGNGNVTFGTTNSIVGTTTNNDAVTGNLGEEINSTISTYTNYTTTATYQNITSITLTAGDWDLSAFFTYSSNSATITAAANAIFVISTTTASAAGATEGKNIAYLPQAALLGTSLFSDAIAPYRVSLSGTTTYYLNTQATFTVGNPQYAGTIRARRVR